MSATERGIMDFNKHVIEEYEKVKDKWQKISGLFDKIEDGPTKVALTIALETERSWIDICDKDKNKNSFHTGVIKYAIPVIAKVYQLALTPQIVSVQPTLHPTGVPATGVVDFRGPGHTLKSENYICKTSKMRFGPNFETMQDLKTVNGISPEQELVHLWGQEYATEWDRGVFTDLRHIAGHLERWDAKDFSTLNDCVQLLRIAIKDMSKKVGQNVSDYYKEENEGKRDGNWVVTSGKLAKELFPKAEHSQMWNKVYVSPIEAGKIDNIKVYTDPLFPRNEMVIGYKGNNLEAGYFFMPYIEMAATPVMPDIDLGNFCPRHGVIRRYGRKLLREGSNFYGRIVFDNLPEKEEK